MSSTPEENRPPEQPRWGQRNPPPGEPGHQSPPPAADESSSQGAAAGYGAPSGSGDSSRYGQSQGYGTQPGYGSPRGPGTPSGYEGQSGYGAPQGPYPGQQPGQHPGELQSRGGSHPGGYGSPSGDRFAAQQKPRRPVTLILAMVLMLLAGAAALALSIFSFLDFASANPQDVDPMWSEVIEDTQAQQGAAGTGGEELTVEDMLYAVGVLALFGGILLAALYTLFAFVGTMTGNVGRILATIFLAGSVFMIIFGPVYLIVTGLSLAAILALWLPASNAYVRSRKAWKDQARGAGPYGDPRGPGVYPGGGQQQWQPAPHNPGPYGSDPYSPGAQSPGGYNPGPYNPGPHGSGPYGSGAHGQGSGERSPDSDENPYGGASRG
ncbi:hypothetical protein [Nesterenkonia lutea]|uniref:DUF4064 domain-containing protein n=1 Tax=Nesterenkonia lutea TaxID=272919 RepID=A0ABR9JAJ1_9MICC|nr:hypothetical protein [Nesterenkonia lutea]MBE1522944.1 hypothetical protein [Nesterenkonia lutea]